MKHSKEMNSENEHPKDSFDYILAGSGMAGLSLLYQFVIEPTLASKRILVIDPVKKTQNDRTWCFWEKKEGPFESLVSHQWKKLQFFAPEVSKTFELKDYSYKMIKSGDFYRHVLDLIGRHENISFVHEKITEIRTENEKAVVLTDKGSYSAPYVFNSTSLYYPHMDESNSLLQHFMGWFIKTDSPTFDSNMGTLMDFRLSQHHGATFMYVLPTSSTEALVEYTLFSPKTLEQEDYIKELESYISGELNIKEYEITHREFGVIPMSMARFKRFEGKGNRVINIGTAGGFTKPSTGYTFYFVQNHVMKIARRLKQGKSPIVKPTLRDQMFLWYDLTLLDVLLSGKLSGQEIFTMLFRKKFPERILAFLANESNFWEEFRIRNSVPFFTFAGAGVKQLVKWGR